MRSLTHYFAAANQYGNPAKFIIGRALVKTGLCRRLAIDCGLYRLWFAPSVYTLNYWLQSDVRRKPDHAFLLAYLKLGETVVDVGANQGMMALTASHAVGAEGSVIAMEPHPATFGILKKNLIINGCHNIRAFNVAVGDSTGTANFSSEQNDSGNSVTANGPLSVPVDTLDNLVRADRIALLKIDVEGYEKFVFAGGQSVLAKTDCVFFEAHEPTYKTFGYCCADVMAMLKKSGFDVYRWADDAYTRICEAAPDYSPCSIPENLLAIRDLDAFMLRTGTTCTIPG